MRKIRWFLSSFLLLFKLSELVVSGAKLVCNEKKKEKESGGSSDVVGGTSNLKDEDDDKLTCHFEVGYDEIAETFVDLNCVADGSKLKCSFDVDKVQEEKDNNDDDKDSVIATSKIQHIAACSDDNEVCFRSFLKTHIVKPSPAGTSAAAEQPEQRETNPQQQQRQQQQQQEINPQQQKQQEFNPQQTQQQEQQQQQSHRNDNGNDDDGGIRVGNYVYKKPYSQYAGPIERTLRLRSTLLLQHQRRQQQQQEDQPILNDIGMEYSIANSYFDLGISHFTAVTEEDYSPGMHSSTTSSTTSNVLQESFDLKLAINAFEMTEQLYTSILKKYDREKPTLYKSFGSLYLQWGEVYQNSHYFDDDMINYHTMTSDPYLQQQEEFNKLALKQYKLSEKYYRLALEELRPTTTTTKTTDDANGDDDPSAKQDDDTETSSSTWKESTKDIEINLAHVSHRIGRCLINSIQGSAVMAEDLQLDQTVDLQDAIPQLTTLMHTVPQAEEKFADAIKLFRNAIQQEIDFDAQNRLKMNLATSLQDGGTAASYASNLPKAIEYQEEGVAISKEILPHVSQSDRFYLTQYIADSMYGISNHYMQLGQYEKTKSTYQYAMDWYEQHNLNPANTAPTTSGNFDMTDATVEAYEKQLLDYHELIREVTMPDGYVEDGQPQYGPNNAYEADLHAALGSLHLSREEVLMAIEHFNEAILLYQKDNVSEENLDRAIADVKVSLAAAYFKQGEFASSAEVHNEAMDIYKVEVGEGKNPILAGLAEKLSGTIDLNDAVASSDLGELLGGEIQELLAGMGVDTTELTAKLEEFTTKGKVEAKDMHDGKEKNPGQPAGKSGNHNDAKEKPGKEAQKVHEELINADIIEKVRQSILNATSSMKGEL